jgi:hypothetical protein
MTGAALARMQGCAKISAGGLNQPPQFLEFVGACELKLHPFCGNGTWVFLPVQVKRMLVEPVHHMFELILRKFAQKLDQQTSMGKQAPLEG